MIRSLTTRGVKTDWRMFESAFRGWQPNNHLMWSNIVPRERHISLSGVHERQICTDINYSVCVWWRQYDSFSDNIIFGLYYTNQWLLLFSCCCCTVGSIECYNLGWMKRNSKVLWLGLRICVNHERILSEPKTWLYTFTIHVTDRSNPTLYLMCIKMSQFQCS